MSKTQTVIPESRVPMLAEVAWSPDGRFVVGDAGCCATGRKLVLFQADNPRIYRTIPYSLRYAFSPDGTQLAIGRPVPLVPPIAIEPGDSSSVVLFDIEAGTEEVVAQGTREALYFPDCWPSPKTLLYHQIVWDEQKQTGQYRLWQVLVETKSRPVQLASGELPNCDEQGVRNLLPADLRASAGRVSWSPDHQWVVLPINPSSENARWGCYLFHIPSRALRRLADGTAPAWRPG